jgi:uncharacterized membrane protein YebE (DUF533 family)
MFDAQKLFDQFLGGGAGGSGGKGGLPDSVKGLAGGAIAGTVASILLGSKGGRKMATSALTYGGVAVLGGLAYKAYRDWQANQGKATSVPQVGEHPMKDITPPPEGTPFLPAPQNERNALGLALISAMIAAAKSDGHVDAEEQKRIWSRLDKLELGAEEKAFIMDELRKPLDIDSVVAHAKSPEMAAEIYAVSCLAIDPDDPAEQAYLAMLASRLKLDPGLKATLEAEVRKVVA